MADKTLLPAVIRVTRQSGEVTVPINGRGRGSAVKSAVRLHRSTSRKGSATAAINKTFHITEREFSRQVEDLLNMFGWRWCHFRPARTEQGWRTALSGTSGFPDYVAVRGTRVLFAEVKSDNGRLSPEQRDWITALDICPGVETYIWRPRMWADIVEILC